MIVVIPFGKFFTGYYFFFSVGVDCPNVFHFWKEQELNANTVIILY